MKARDPLRPIRLVDYIGQNQIKEILGTAMKAAKERDEPLDHVLLNGPPGLGKTTLANIIANEMGWTIEAIIGTSLSNPAGAKIYIYGRKAKTILFIDEVHRMRRPIQELFYPVLEDGELQLERVRVELKPLTVIGATTQIGRLEQPFIDRFPLQFQLEYYGVDDLWTILENSAQKLKVDQITSDGLEAIAKRARGTPRIANNLLRRVRDFVQVLGKEADQGFVEDILGEKLGIDAIGLDRVDRQYLQVLADCPEGIGAEAIATTLSQSQETVEDFIEPFLLRLGFIERRRNGRWLTDAGKRHLRKTK